MFPCSVNKQEKIKLRPLPACSKFNWKIMNCHRGPSGFFADKLIFPGKSPLAFCQNLMNKRHEGNMAVDGRVWGWTALENVSWAAKSAPRFPPAGQSWQPGGCGVLSWACRVHGDCALSPFPLEGRKVTLEMKGAHDLEVRSLQTKTRHSPELHDCD